MADFNSNPELVEAFWNYHVLRGVWWTSNLTAGTAGGGSSTTSAARKRRKGKRDGNDVVDESGLDGQSLLIPTLLAPDITPYANVSGGQRVIARSSSSSGSDGKEVVSFYSGTTGGTSENIQKSTITHANFNFSGGTIHIIDHVLSLPSRLNDTLASFDHSSSSSSSSSSSTNNDDTDESDLLSLTASVGALSRANLTDIFNSQRDITMFVPSNSAWNAVGSVVSDMNEDELAQIMGYHVLKGQSGKVFYSDLLEQTSSSDSSGNSDVDSDASDGTETGTSSGTEAEDDGKEFEKDYETVEGGKVKVRVVDGSSSSTGGDGKDDDDDDGTGGSEKQVFVNGARMVKSDVLVENGVVHIVDG